ncbi:hypothetical protein [Planococcus shixiaomingii]|uniref:hypothetical protein n=1 Tax=Planococcus shixiaomingii TaxID=3058393 RepID=UPI0026098E6A|nr:hypothetical protein [Planococcus sp. N022]WKA56517.1 hypothetical protein QWY21_09265 [Planococcus sp. N022]
MPGIEKVIEIHEQVLSVSNAPAAIIGGLLWVFLGVAFVVYLFKEKKNFSLQEWVFNGVFLGIVLLILGGLSFAIKDYDFSISEKQWKENYLNPYLKGLPENKEYVEDFSQIVPDEEDAIKSI